MSAPTDPMELLALQKGWDSNDAEPPDRDTVIKASTVGAAIANLFSCSPNYVPCSDGSVQIEWHCDGWDVEVWIQRVKAASEETP